MKWRAGQARWYRYWPVNREIPDGWTDRGVLLSHHGHYSRLIMRMDDPQLDRAGLPSGAQVVNRPEQSLQISIVSKILAPLEAAGRLTYAAFSNGFYRTPAEAGIARAMGQRAGQPDLEIMLPGGRLFYVELKAPKGRVSPDQAKRGDLLRALGFTVWIVRSQEEMMTALEREGVI